MAHVSMVPWLAVASALVLMATGCGGSANLVPVDGTNGKSTKNLLASSAPIVVDPSPYVSNPPTQQPNIGTATQLQIANKQVQNGKVSKIVVTVDVRNPTSYPLTGDVKIVFTDGGKATAKTQTKTVTVAPLGSETVSFEDPSWTLDDGNVEVVTQNAGYDPHGSTYRY